MRNSHVLKVVGMKRQQCIRAQILRFTQKRKAVRRLYICWRDSWLLINERRLRAREAARAEVRRLSAISGFQQRAAPLIKRTAAMPARRRRRLTRIAAAAYAPAFAAARRARGALFHYGRAPEGGSI